MAFSKNKEFSYSFGEVNRIVEEKGNQFTRFAQIIWNSDGKETIKYDLRKYVTEANGNEKMLKGLSFLSDNGPHELAHVLVEEGFGTTSKILTTIKERNDFREAVNDVYGENTASNEEDLIDLRDLL